jgi:hypothetical protein
MICPFCAGRLRAANLAQRKVSRTAPLVELPDGVERCCGGIVTVPASFLTLVQGQGLRFLTTAWTRVYGPRSLVETANSLLKERYANLSRTYTKLMGLAKRKFAVAFLLAAINRRVARAWRAKQAELPAHRARQRRYEQTIAGLLASAPTPKSQPHSQPGKPAPNPRPIDTDGPPTRPKRTRARHPATGKLRA